MTENLPQDVRDALQLAAGEKPVFFIKDGQVQVRKPD